MVPPAAARSGGWRGPQDPHFQSINQAPALPSCAQAIEGNAGQLLLVSQHSGGLATPHTSGSSCPAHCPRWWPADVIPTDSAVTRAGVPPSGASRWPLSDHGSAVTRAGVLRPEPHAGPSVTTVPVLSLLSASRAHEI